MKYIMIISLLFTLLATKAQQGCMDPQASNYNSTATQNDGSCIYNPTNYSLTWKDSLPVQLNEISGMVYWQGKLYVHNDSGTPNHIYELDTLHGLITKTIILGTVTPVDWEDITQDSLYFYLADVGNNIGTRTDLVVYKFPKAAMDTSTLCTIPDSLIESIHFAYPDQTSFASNSNTPFDCEAIAYRDQKLHLFTKNWSGNTSVHYSIPVQAGTYTAMRLDSLNTNGFLITAADFANNAQLMLIGYKTTFPAECAFWYCYDFSNPNECFAKGNKRQIDLGNAATIGQVEGVCFKDNQRGFVSNERFIPSASFNFPNQLYSFSTSAWYPYQVQNSLNQTSKSNNPFSIYSSSNGIEIRSLVPREESYLHQIYDASGRIIFSEWFHYTANQMQFTIPLKFFSKQFLVLRITNRQGKKYYYKLHHQYN